MQGQREFDFGELSEKPKPPLPHFDEPEDDNQELLNWQWEYREHGSQKALELMYEKGFRIALRFINCKARRNRHIARLSDSEREEKAHNAITYIIARYITHEDFVITKSFTAYLYLRVQHELYYQRKVDGIVDFVDWETFKK